MSTPAQGMYATIGIGGTVVGLLTGIDFNWTRPVGEFTEMGTHVTTSAFSGVTRYSGAFRKAYVGNDFIKWIGGTAHFSATLTPRSGSHIVGTLILTGGSLSNMEHEETAAIIEEGTFIMYTLTVT